MSAVAKNREFPSFPLVVLVLDVPRLGQTSVEFVVKEAVQGGVGMVILRDRVSPAGQIFARAEAIRAWIPKDVVFLINDRCDIALACGADGVHLPELGLPVPVVRQQSGYNWWIGRSVHSMEAAKQAEESGVDYLLLGTLFSTECKPNHVPEGISLLHAVCSEVSLPVVGIGGIHAANADLVWKAGAYGVALASGLMQSTHPAALVRQLREI